MIVHHHFPSDFLYILDEVEQLQDYRRTSSGLWRHNRPSTAAVLELKTELEAYLGTPVQDWWVMKHLPGGAEVFMHDHNDWGTAIYYPAQHETGLITENGIVSSETARLVVLRPRESHGVQANATQEIRYSVVFLFDGDHYPEGPEGSAD